MGRKFIYYGKYLIEIYVLFYLIIFTGFNYQIANREILEINVYVIAVLSALWLWYLLVNKKREPNQKEIPYKETFYIFILVYISSVIHSVNLEYSMNELFLWSLTAFIFFGIYALIRWRIRLRHEIMTSLLIIGILYNFMKLGQLLLNWQEYINTDCGFRGIFSPNKTAGMTNFILIMSLSLLIASFHRQRQIDIRKKERKTRILPYIGFITSGVLLFFTGSRGGYIAGVAGVAIVLLVDLVYTQKTRKLNIYFMTAVVILLLAFPIVGTLVNRPESCQSNWGSNITTRVEAIELSFDLWSNKPLLGQGPGTYPYLAGPVFDYSSITSHPHNVYIKILSERGILGIIASGFLLLAFLKVIIQDIPHVTYKLTGVGVLVVFMVHGIVDVTLSEPYLMRFMFALLAVVVSAGRKQILYSSTELMKYAEYN